MRRALLVAIACSLAVACDRKGPPAVGEYRLASDGGQTLDVNGIRFEAAADLPERTGDHTLTVNGDNMIVVQLRSWPVVVAAGRLRVADRDYGPAPAGSVVRLSKDGVRVGSELRGPLP